MAEYRIVAKIDPQTAAGSQKVKQDLRGVAQEARATEAALTRSFDQARFESTIGGLIARLDGLEKGLGSAAGASATLAKSNENLGQTLDRVAAGFAKTNAPLKTNSTETQNNTTKQQGLEAALMRVLRATDMEAAEQQRLNALLVDAKRLLDAGSISQERYAQVQALATRSAKEQAAVTGSQRIGMTQLGFQLGDIATMWSLGAKPAQIFASQIGQVSQALMLMGGGGTSMLARVASFLGGPWGVALTVGTILLAPLIDKLFQTNDALGDSVKKLREDAKETELNARAKEIFAKSVEGVTARIREQNAELKKSIETWRDLSLRQMESARSDEARVQGQQAAAARELAEARRAYDTQKARQDKYGPGINIPGVTIGLSERLATLQEAERKYQDLTKAVGEAREAVLRSDAAYAQSSAERLTDPIAKLNDQYDQQRKKIIDTYAAQRDNSDTARAAMARELVLLELRRDKAVEAAQAQDRLNGSVAKGVSVFRSREQAIGIAGREFQQAGLKVGENTQFGGVKGNHPGMGNAAHGRFAIDVNEGSGIVEADVPDLKAKFDAAARRYQQRGFRVLWNGWVYEAGGNGPTRRIPAGQHQHRDHMHLEAPGTIVGKATGASTESQYQREEGQAGRVAERAEDFVAAIQARAASQGLPSDRQSQLNAQIDEALAEFTRRFDRAATDGEAATIRKALTDADVRETAQRFEEAYVKPLDRLRALQGTTGIERDILNAKLEETARLGRELTPIEAAMIENGIRQGDQLTRQQQILSQIAEPLETYRSTIAALNALLAEGAINQTTYNARLGELMAAASQFKGGLPGQDSQGRNFGDQADREEAGRKRDSDLAQLQSYLAQGTILEQEAAAIRTAIWRQYGDTMQDIDNRRFNNARDLLGQLSQLQNSKSKELAAIGKAAAVTQATMDAYLAINKALATLPPPFNIAMAGAIGATAFANVTSILGLKDGGLVRGPGGPRDDKVPIWGSNGEFMVNARDTARNRPLLEAINQGRDVRQAGVVTAAAREAATPGRVIVAPTPAPEVNIRQINVTDPRMIDEYMSGPAGERMFTNWVNSNPEVVARAAQQGS